MSFLYWGAQNWTPSGVLSRGGVIIFLVLLALCLQTQPRVLLAFTAAKPHCWFLCCLLPGKTSTSFSAVLLRPQPILVQGSPPPQVQDYAFVLAEFHQSSCKSIPSACPGPSGWQPCPQLYRIVILIWCCLQTSGECTTSPPQAVDNRVKMDGSQDRPLGYSLPASS